MPWNNAVFFEALARHNMLEGLAVYVPPSTGVPIAVPVGWFEPDRRYLGAIAQSKDYEIEYEASALPGLDVNSEITVNGARFRVREVPFTPEFNRDGNNGFWRHAILTKLP